MNNSNQNPIESYRDDVQIAVDRISSVFVGRKHVIEAMFVAIICGDHILLEDVPGTGKTMLAKLFADSFGLKFSRVQGTPDILPTDLSGVSVFNSQKQEFEFIPGPIFTNILLFDEINRASPKTQSALLEAMAEKQVSIDNKTYLLDSPFFVIATQNPVDHLGTYLLPQAQLDRFLFKVQLGYPNREEELSILNELYDEVDESNYEKLEPAVLESWVNEFEDHVHIADDVVNKLLDIVIQTREHEYFDLGISPRALRKFVKAIKARAYIYGRDFVNKNDIYQLFMISMSHKVVSDYEIEGELEEMLHKANF